MYRFFVTLLQPYPLLFLAAGIALVLLWRRRTESRAKLLWVAVPVVLLTLVNLPVVANLSLGSLEWSYRPENERPEDMEAIVVLCGYVRPPGEFFPEAELGSDTLYRCLHAAKLYRQGKRCLVIVSGGKPEDAPGPTMAETMRDFLLTQGVSQQDILTETIALSGYENAVESAKLLSERGVNKVLLVTSAVHMPRAAACFRAQGIDVTPAPCDFLSNRSRPGSADFWPNADAGRKFQVAAREWLGLAWYWLHGRI